MADCVLLLVGERRVAVPTARVREVAQAQQVTPVPTAPPPVVGLTQLRGQILPVLDLGEPGHEPRVPKPTDPLVVVEVGALRAALLCDHVLGVAADPPEERLDVSALFEALKARVQPA
jgi:chemotaxis signal transduction protein